MNEENDLLKAPYIKSILNALTDMARIVTKEGRVAYTNKAYERKLSGIEPSTGEFCYDALSDVEGSEECLSRSAFLEGRTMQRTRKMNGRVYAVTASPILGAQDEIVAVFETFREVTLDYNIKRNLLEQNAKMQQDLSLANRLQEAFTKNVMPEVPGYTIDSAFYPCERVGGDMFDCILCGDKLVMYIADVSGHGVMPAMLAVFFSRAVDTACKLDLVEPAQILDYVQNEYKQLDVSDSIYITGFVLVLDIATGTFTYANAGLSVAPLIYRNKCVEELYMPSPPISRWFLGQKYAQKEDVLGTGERVLLFSDGVPDLQTDDAVKAQFEALFAVEDFSTRQFLYAVRRDMQTRRQDDLTLLVCSRDGA